MFKPPVRCHYNLTFVLILLFTSHLFAQRHDIESFDVLEYTFEISVNDTNNSIYGLAVHTIRMPKDTLLNQVQFDLSNQMVVDNVKINEQLRSFSHNMGSLLIKTQPCDSGVLNIKIQYSGEPLDGLYISKNRYGKRTFFTDHWPDRAHHWLPVVDHPADKAIVQFKVRAPKSYEVISNGLFQSRVEEGDYALTQWKTQKPISTKILALGIADFTINEIDALSSVWVYTDTSEKEASDFEDASLVFDFLEQLLGDFPFEKLDHIESSTQFGGMENASCIFYNENLINGNHDINALIAHEVAHQWFGNSATEKQWKDIWLSEGFATFYQEAYLEAYYGVDSLQAYLKEQESTISMYEKENPNKVIVQKTDNLIEILNPLTYQKAAWFLRMLQYRLGEDVFTNVIRTYLADYKYSNASTDDFLKVAESISGLHLGAFFDQWLLLSGSPDVKYKWRYKKGRLYVGFVQETNHVYDLDFELLIEHEDDTYVKRRVDISQRKQTIVFNEPKYIINITVDPANLIYGEFKQSINLKL